MMISRILLLAAVLSVPLSVDAEGVTGWLNWRGPLQSGVSLEKDLPATWEIGGKNHLWSYKVIGGGTPVVAEGKLYAFGFYGEKGEDVEETLLCLDANTGKKIWEHRFSDYISDVVYNRYGIGSPTIDAETGNVYLQASNGRCMAFTRDGKKLWEHSLMEELGRLTFPNGRTGACAVDGNLAIFHCVTANWGTTGPARDRFYAFDKTSGELVWYSTPGIRPVDSSFGMPVFGDLGGRRVFYCGTGCGNVVCVNARTGEPVWRFQLSQGGVNSNVVLYGDDKLIAIHGKENIDTTSKGRLVCLKIPTEYPAGDKPRVLGASAELWRNDEHVAFTSSPTLVGDRVYSTIATGSLLCVDAATGKTLWSEKLAPDQLHASPLAGDGKLYVPMMDGKFYILKPGDEKAEHLHETEVGAVCLGAPAAWAGKVYLMTKGGLHCFGRKDGTFVGVDPPATPAPGEIAALQIVPAEFALSAGQSQDFKVWGLDANGVRVREIKDPAWEKFIPPSAKVKAEVDAAFEGNTLVAGENARLSAGAFKATWNNLSATTRGRVEAGIGYAENFDAVPLPMKNAAGEAVNFPPLPWLGARIKWHVLERDGNKVIANRLDNILFQRTMNFFGSADLSNYIVEADVMTDGNRRIMSTVGLVNQRYLITLVGNAQILEVTSNHERVKQSVKFSIKPNTWYRLKTHVAAKKDGSGTVRAKAWPRDLAEPEGWTIEVPVRRVHRHGAPAVFAFSPQAMKRVYIDNLKIRPAK
jgi:outer membrane protein assembly factor BamB